MDRIKNAWKENDGTAVTLGVAIAALLVYSFYFTNDLLNSDCYAEGLLTYGGGTRCIELGCWASSYYYKLTALIVHPVFNHLIYTICMIIVTMLLNNLWRIENKTMRVLSGMSLMVAPAITGQLIYVYVYPTFGLACMFAVCSVYILFRSESYKTIIPAACIMAVSLGFYSIYFGTILFVGLGTLIIGELRDQDEIFYSFIRRVIKCLVYTISGLAIFYAIMVLHLTLYHTSRSGYAGGGKVSIINTIANIPRYLKSTYRIFITYYRDVKPFGYLFWSILIVTAIACMLYISVSLLKNRKYLNTAAIWIMLMAIPPSANIMLIIMPEHGMQLHWIFQMQLMAPFCTAIIGLTAGHLNKQEARKIIYSMTAICIISIIINYSFCVYSSMRTLEIGNRHIRLYIQNAITHAIEDEEYTEDMPIVFMGFVNDDSVQEKNPLRQYSYFERAYPFWKDRYEVFSVWPRYCWYNFGIDIGEVTPEQHDKIIASDKFKTMDQYPSNKAYAIIDGCYVILMDRDSVK